ncbi:hypothetical protein D3C74_271970 [compost metagenome]
MGNFILYSTKSISLLEPGEFIFNNPIEGIESIKLTFFNEPIQGPSEYGKINFYILFSDKIDFESAKSISAKFVDDYCDHLSFVKEIGLESPAYVKDDFQEKSIITSEITGKFKIARPISKEDVYAVKSSVIQNELTKKYLRLYRTALNNEDSLSRFMLLYSVIEFVIPGIGQPKVCRFAKKHGYKRDYRNIEKNRDECIFTWLRNKIGHTNGDEDFEKIKNMMSENVSKLAELVRKAITTKFAK